MFDFQASLIFPTHAVPPAGSLPPGAERLSLETGDGNRLEGIHIPAEGHSAEKVLILGASGGAALRSVIDGDAPPGTSDDDAPEVGGQAVMALPKRMGGGGSAP